MVNSLIPALVTDSNLVVNVFFPEKEGLKVPSKEEILAAVNKVKAETLTAYEDKVSDEPLISEKPQGGKITNRKWSVRFYYPDSIQWSTRYLKVDRFQSG